MTNVSWRLHRFVLSILTAALVAAGGGVFAQPEPSPDEPTEAPSAEPADAPPVEPTADAPPVEPTADAPPAEPAADAPHAEPAAAEPHAEPAADAPHAEPAADAPHAEPLPPGSDADIEGADAKAKGLMPDAAAMTPTDDDGDGVIEESEMPLAFDVPDALQGAEYLTQLKHLIESMRGKIITKMVQKTAAKQSASMGLMLAVMLGLTAAGLLILLTPLVLRKRYPGRERLLWRGALLGAGAYMLTMLILTAALFILRTAKDETALIVNPPLSIANAAFDAIRDRVDMLGDDAALLVEPPIAMLASGQQEGLVESVLENVAQFRSDLDVFRSLAAFFKGLNWLFAAFGTILVLLAVVLFLSSQRKLLADILSLPSKAAAGDAGSFGAVMGEMTRRTGREVAALSLTVMVLVGLALLSGVLLAVAVVPAVSTLMDTILIDIYYIFLQTDAERILVYLSLFGAGIFLGLVILFILFGNAFFLAKMQKVLQQKFRYQIPASNYRRFWIWGPIASLWVQILPVLFVFGASFAFDAIDFDTPTGMNWTLMLALPAVVLVVGLPLVMWLGQGFRAMKFLRKYDHLQGSPEAKAPKSGAPSLAA